MKQVGFIQFRPHFGGIKSNLDRAEKLIRSADEADLLVLPELAFTGYEFQDSDEVLGLSEVVGEGPVSERMMNLAVELDMNIVVGFAEREGDDCYNSCMLVEAGSGNVHVYRKIHLFDREKELFTSGDAPPPVIETSVGRVGLMICFDWIFPETARLLALSGAQIIAHPSNLVLQFCQRAMFARSVENGVFSITCNRIGTEERAGRAITFTGASQVMTPRGEVLVAAPEDRERVAVVAIDPLEADDKMITDHNHRLEDRRVELYGGLLEVKQG